MDQLDWEGDDEFSFKGEMYDVIEKKIEDGKLIIRSIADRRETALLNTLRGHWNQNEKSNKVADELFQLLQSLFHSSRTEEFVLIKPLVHRMSFYFIFIALTGNKNSNPASKMLSRLNLSNGNIY
jgi:hypothetical protein